MTYRVLDVDTEWHLLEHEFRNRNVPMPDPRFAMIIAAFDKENGIEVIEGFVVCQLQFHAEPLVVYNPHCLTGLISTLEKELLRRVGACNYYAFADGKVAQIAQLLGFQKVSEDIFRKELTNKLE